MTFSIDIHQDTLVKKVKPAVVKVYDYYEPGKNENRRTLSDELGAVKFLQLGWD